jgi:uncharacterized circularly permuted ATP-grasp superfamily protein
VDNERSAYPGTGFDEAVDGGDALGRRYAEVLAQLRAVDLEGLARRMDERVRLRGIRFTGSSGDEWVHVDPVPRLIVASEWRWLRDGLAQRSRALNAFILDVYGARRIIAEGVLPARVVETADHFEPSMAGAPFAPIPAPVIGFDLVRGTDGRMAVLEDNVRTPSGLAYAVAVRQVSDEVLDLADVPPRGNPRESVALLRDALAAHDSRAVVLTDGPDNSAWFEHEGLGAALGLPVVTPGELECRGGSIRARGTSVQLVYRRTDEDRLRDDHDAPTWLDERLGTAVRDGRVRMVNAPGAGVADDKLSHAHVEDMVRFYLGEEPRVPSVRSLDLCDQTELDEALDRLEELVVKPRAGFGGEGVVICADIDRQELERVRAAIRRHPREFVVQARVELSTHPTVIDGHLEARRVDLRGFTIGGELGPAALTRVAMERGGTIVNSSQNGGVKDTWILRDSDAA